MTHTEGNERTSFSSTFFCFSIYRDFNSFLSISFKGRRRGGLLREVLEMQSELPSLGWGTGLGEQLNSKTPINTSTWQDNFFHGLVLWHVNHCRLFNAKSCLCIYNI